MYDAVGTSRVLCPEHAVGEDELHRKESRTFGDVEQRRKQDFNGLGNDVDHDLWDYGRLLDVIAENIT